MRCAVFYGVGDLRVEDWEVPHPGPSDVLVKVSVCGVCHTDVAIMDGGWPVGKVPGIIGHEYTGTVVEAGAEVSTVRVGDRVAILPLTSCGHCALCRRSLEFYCLNRRGLSGGYAEYATLPQTAVYRLPEGVSDLAASMAEPVSVCLHAVERANLQPGETAVVLGGGPIGLTLVQMARVSGAGQVILSEPDPARRALGLKLGASLGVDPRTENLEETVRQATDGAGADCVLEAVGLPLTVEQSLRLLRKGGTAVIVGVADREALARVNPFDMLVRELSLSGTLGAGPSFERAVRLLPALSLDILFTHEFTLENIHQAINHRRTVDGLKGFVRT